MALNSTTFIMNTITGTTSGSSNFVNPLNPPRFKIPTGNDVRIKQISCGVTRTDSTTGTGENVSVPYFQITIQLRTIESARTGQPPIGIQGQIISPLANIGASVETILSLTHFSPFQFCDIGWTAGEIRIIQAGWSAANAGANDLRTFWIRVDWENIVC